MALHLTMQCPHCYHSIIKKNGFYRQKLTRKYIQRFQCKHCRSKFSTSTLSITYQQKKPFINKTIYLGLCSATSLRRLAKNLGVSFMTVYRRFLWMSSLAETAHKQFLDSLTEAQELFLDEMESIEHTKLKPLTIPLIIDANQRILGVQVGEIPAKGQLASIARKKYGPRNHESELRMRELLESLPKSIRPLVVNSDGKSSYPELIKNRWPGVIHRQHPRRPEKIKETPFLMANKVRFDPMFAINQRCAKLRADVNRLIRRSWCTTKKLEHLRKHLLIYACYNNGLSLV